MASKMNGLTSLGLGGFPRDGHCTYIAGSTEQEGREIQFLISFEEHHPIISLQILGEN